LHVWYRRRKAGCSYVMHAPSVYKTNMPYMTHDHNTLHYQSQRRPRYTQQNFTMAIGIFTILAGLLALTAAYFYFFGISPETKRKMEQQALKTMGENKMSYMAKGE
jgi:hypothetical protein